MKITKLKEAKQKIIKTKTLTGYFFKVVVFGVAVYGIVNLSYAVRSK
jgi:hypothetical protein